MKFFTFICCMLFIWTQFLGIWVTFVLPEAWDCYKNPDSELNLDLMKIDPVTLKVSASFQSCE